MTADATLPASDDLAPEVLARWEELAANATEGPWRITEWSHFVSRGTEIPDFRVEGPEADLEGESSRDDAEFIAAARTAVPALLSGVRSRDARIAELEAVIEEAPHEHLCHSKYSIGFPSRERHECDCWKSRYTAGVDQ